MAKRYQGNVISSSPVEPASGLEDGAASGVWSVTEANRYKKADTWPTDGVTLAFSGDRILIPYYTSTYNTNYQIYNFNTNTLTDLGTESSAYLASAGALSIFANGDNIVALAAAAGTGTFKNMIYVPSSNSPSYYHMDPLNYPTYGSYFGDVIWNPEASKWQTVTYPFFTQGNTTTVIQFTNSASTTTTGLGANIPGRSDYAPTGVTRMYERSASNVGDATFGDFILLFGAEYGTGKYPRVARDESPFSSPSFSTTNLGSSASYPQVRGIAPIDKDVAIMLTPGYGEFLYNPSTDTATSINYVATGTGSIYALAGNVSPQRGRLIQLSKNILCDYSASGAIVYKTDTSFNISWATDVYAELGGSGRAIEMVIGAGLDAYVWWRLTSGTYQHYMSKLTFNASTGAVSTTTNTLSGLTANYGYNGQVKYDYS